MSNKSVILIATVSTFLLFTIVNYHDFKTRTFAIPIQEKELLQQVQPEGSVLPKEALSLDGIEDSRKEIKDESSQFQKPSKATFTVQVGAFRNAPYAKALATRLDEMGYKAYTTSLKEKDGRLFKVCVGNFKNRQEAQSLSKKIKKTEDLQTLITLY